MRSYLVMASKGKEGYGKGYAIGVAGSGKDARCGQGLPGFLHRESGYLPVSDDRAAGCFFTEINCIGNKMMQRQKQLC